MNVGKKLDGAFSEKSPVEGVFRDLPSADLLRGFRLNSDLVVFLDCRPVTCWNDVTFQGKNSSVGPGVHSCCATIAS
jgi:hypothetical protein